MLCRPQADVGRQRQPEFRPWPTFDANVGVVLALADVGRRRQRCVGAVSASADVGGRHFCYPSVMQYFHTVHYQCNILVVVYLQYIKTISTHKVKTKHNKFI